jgi:hypothetical protein
VELPFRFKPIPAGPMIETLLKGEGTRLVVLVNTELPFTNVGAPSLFGENAALILTVSSACATVGNNSRQPTTAAVRIRILGMTLSTSSGLPSKSLNRAGNGAVFRLFNFINPCPRQIERLLGKQAGL